MSVRDCCQIYRCPSNGYWKTLLGGIMAALKTENHPDQEIFSSVACTLMMHDVPRYSRWLDIAITKLIDDPISRLDPLPDLPNYDEMSCKDLVDKYENDGDEKYPRNEILTELRYRYPLLFQSNEAEFTFDLRDQLKDFI